MVLKKLENWLNFSKFSEYSFLLLYYSACKRATATIFIWVDREYHPVRFEYKPASEGYLVILKTISLFRKIEIVKFFENTQNCFAYNSATKYLS